MDLNFGVSSRLEDSGTGGLILKVQVEVPSVWGDRGDRGLTYDGDVGPVWVCVGVDDLCKRPKGNRDKLAVACQGRAGVPIAGRG